MYSCRRCFVDFNHFDRLNIISFISHIFTSVSYIQNAIAGLV